MSSYLISKTDMEDESEPLIVKVEDPNHDADPSGPTDDQITTATPPSAPVADVKLNLFGYILLVAGTLVAAPVCLLINGIIHVIDSVKGDSGERKVVSPISPKAATLTLLFLIIVSSTTLVIVINTPNGPQIAQWIQAFLVILGYMCLGTSTEYIISKSKCCDVEVEHKQWFRAVLEVTYWAILYPTAALMSKVAPILGDFLSLSYWTGVAITIIVGQNAIGLVAHGVVWSFRCGVKCSHEVVQEYEREERKQTDEEEGELKKLEDKVQRKRENMSKKRTRKGREKSKKEIDELLEQIQSLALSREEGKKVRQQELDRKLRIKCQGPKCSYYRLKGLRRSITFVAVAFAHLLTWVLYFRPQLTKEVTDFGIWTFLCELLMAVLWLLKDFILLSWQGKTLSDKKFRRKLKHWTCLCYFHLIQCRRSPEIQPLFTSSIFVNPLVVNQNTKWRRKEDQWKEAITRLVHLVAKVKHQDDSCPVSIHDKELFARAFLPDCARFLPNKEEISNFESSSVTQEMLDLVNKYDKSAAGSIDAGGFPAWTKRAYENCSQLQRLIVSGHEVVNFLNKIMMGFIIALVLIVWLRLTQVLPTQAIVAVTSTILGATFIFGDTLKTMFQGFIFVCITHPFAIGDVCVINQTQLEVKEIGIRRTTFTKIGTEDQVVYPNSVLAGSAIISYEGDTVDLDDFVEFGSDSAMDPEMIDILAKDITRLISEGAVEANQQLQNAARHSQVSTSNEIEEIDAHHGRQASNSEPNAHIEAYDESQQKFHNKVVVDVQQVQDNTKVTVHFKHQITILDTMTSAEASIEKIKRKSKILADIANLLSKFRYGYVP